MICPTPDLRIDNLEAERETSGAIHTDGKKTVAVKGKCLTVRDTEGENTVKVKGECPTVRDSDGIEYC